MALIPDIMTLCEESRGWLMAEANDWDTWMTGDDKREFDDLISRVEQGEAEMRWALSALEDFLSGVVNSQDFSAAEHESSLARVRAMRDG